MRKNGWRLMELVEGGILGSGLAKVWEEPSDLEIDLNKEFVNRSSAGR
jgi:hypothetical protein